MKSRRLFLVAGIPVALLVALQLVPYGRDRSAPPDGPKPAWSSAATADLARRACFDCHSNETRWPWYASVAPLSWRIWNHVREGREHLDFTAFDPTREKVADAAREAGESVTKKKMPPADYLLAHPEARLTAAEREALAAGLDATFAGFAGEEHRGKGREGRERGEGERREH